MEQNYKNLILIGYSGHSLVISETAVEVGFHLLGYTDIEKKDFNPLGLNYLGKEETLDNKFFNNENYFFVSIGNNLIRSKVSRFIRSKTTFIPNIIHPSSFISKNIKIGSGNFISKNVAINSFSEIQNDVIINTSATIEHECLISSGVHVAPGAVLLGNVQVGKNSFIGANSVIKQGTKIGENVVIGAGSVVLNDVDNNSIIYGNPAKYKV